MFSAHVLRAPQCPLAAGLQKARRSNPSRCGNGVFPGIACPLEPVLQIRMLYVSRPVGPQTTTVTASILATAQAHNRAHDICGVLCQGQGLYLQVLEGERSAVNRLYRRIVVDRRHEDVELLLLEEITQRRFADWSMAHVQIYHDDPIIQMKHPEFDPYSAPGPLVLTLVEELVASGSRITLPPP